jgi:hypothetical protein
VSTFIDGTSPSVNPDPDDDEDDDGGYGVDDGFDDTDGSAWLQAEIQRRIAAGRRASKGRHARREVASSTSSIAYVPRHSTATPGPGTMPPAPLATPSRGIPRVPSAWSSPPGPMAPDLPPAPEEPPARFDGPEPVGHRGTMLAGGTAVVPLEGAPPPWRSGDPLTATSVRKAAERAAPVEEAGPPAPDPETLDSKRVRVVLSERRNGARPVRTVVDIQEGTGVGELLRKDLISSQLGVAGRFAALALITLGALPLLFWAFPEIGRWELAGIRVPWLLLGVLVYPFLMLVGLWHTRTAERVEQGFADHVQD